MTVREPCELTVIEAASAIAAGNLSAVRLTRSCLDRIDALEDRVQAWASVDRKGAMETAERLDRESRRGHSRGILHGIPVGVKDIFHVAGLRTKAGSRFLDLLPSYDATSVARLKEAGAVILGKTHTTEFAYFHPAPTRNPWNPQHTPGGSSSGSAASVAAGMCLAALGSQTLGSVLRPAAYNGLVGFKPQHGRISTFGVIPVSWTLDHVGIIARSVEDAAAIFQAIAGYDPKDCHSLSEKVPDCVSKPATQKKPVLGLVRQYFYDHANQEMRDHTESVVEILRRAGARILETELPPSFSNIMADGATIMAVEAAAYHEAMFAEHTDEYGAEMRGLIKNGLNCSAVEYAKKLQSRLQQRHEAIPMFREVDALLTPGAPGAAPYGLNSTGSPVMQAPWTILGVPSISLPTGLSENGLPLAIQLAGAPLAEDRLLSAAVWCEMMLKSNLWPARYPALS